MHVQFFHKSLDERGKVKYSEGEYLGPYAGLYVQNDVLAAKTEQNESYPVARRIDGHWVEAVPNPRSALGPWTGFRLFADLGRGR